jgi:hypothetical protein
LSTHHLAAHHASAPRGRLWNSHNLSQKLKHYYWEGNPKFHLCPFFNTWTHLERQLDPTADAPV